MIAWVDELTKHTDLQNHELALAHQRPQAPRIAFGWLAATAVGAVGAALAGAAVGALVDLGIADEDVPVYSESVRRGGVAVSVRFPDDARMLVDASIISRSCGVTS